jgi:tetratricopeptide (TPR) repeat protein
MRIITVLLAMIFIVSLPLISTAQEKAGVPSYESGMKKLEAKEYQDAAVIFAELAGAKRAELKVFLAAASAYQGMGQYKEAISILKRAIKTFPKEIKLHLRIAEIYRENGDLDSSIQWYEKLLALDSGNLYAVLQVAQTCFDNSKIEQSAYYFRKAVSLDGSKPAPHYWLGTIYILQDKIPAAIKSLESYLELDKDNSFGAVRSAKKNLVKLRKAAGK